MKTRYDEDEDLTMCIEVSNRPLTITKSNPGQQPLHC